MIVNRLRFIILNIQSAILQSELICGKCRYQVKYLFNFPEVSAVGKKKIPEKTPNNKLFKNTSAAVIQIYKYKYKCVI